MYILNQKNRNNFLSVFVFILLITNIFIPQVYAATLGFRPDSGSYSVGDTINVKIIVNSASKSINAVQAQVKFSNDVLSLSSISKSGSIINLWAQEPSYSNSSGTASLEGVVLSGYSGTSGTVATLVFRVKASGNANIQIQTASVLANDGNGTEVLTSKNNASFNITQTAPVKPKEVSVVPENKPVKDNLIVISEIKNTDSADVKKSFIFTPSEQVKDDAYTVVIDDLDPIIYLDDGSHVFVAPILTNGSHTMKVIATGESQVQLNGVLKFSTQSVKVPVITYYPSLMYIDSFMVLKGIADPYVDVELTITNTNTGVVSIEHVQTNSDGKFTFVPDDKMIAGTYSIIGRAINKDNVTSDYMPSIQIENKDHALNMFVSRASGYVTLLTPLIALLALLSLVGLYSFYHIKKAHSFIKRKLSSTEDLVAKSFGILEEDVDEEMSISKKIKANKPLTKEEKVFLGKFKRDIKDAEKIIKEEVRNIENKE